METTYKEFIDNILETRGRFACGDEYHERHHIVPRCLGGTNDKENLIDLFAREHFEAHRLLALENPDNKSLIFAWTCMAFANNNQQIRYKLTPEEYESARATMSVKMSGKNNVNYRKHPTEDTRRKLSEVRKGEKNHFYGKHHTEETKRKISEKAIGRKISKEVKQKMSIQRSGINHPNTQIVCQYDKNMNLIHIWSFIREASNKLGISHSNISACCRGKHNCIGGFIWRYLYDRVSKDNTVIQGAITLGLITEEEALKQLEKQKEII